LNTHSNAALYETFSPEDARRIARKLEWHPTPVHGSWLNMVEIEIRILLRQCLNRRLATKEQVQHESTVWARKRTAEHRTVEWKFTTAEARNKLQRMYPTRATA
jgi:methionyl-tRNA formyltransferase